MELSERVGRALSRGWEVLEGRDPGDTSLPANISSAVDLIIFHGSNPNRQFLLTIAAGTAHDPSSNPASLQLAAGVDRRGQEQIPRQALTEFRNEKGLTLKISQDAGVSNQWREQEINADWVGRRRTGADRSWAQAFFDIVQWLSSFEPAYRREPAQELLDYVAVRIVSFAASNQLNYPRFRVTPARAMALTMAFLDAAPDRPDALEAVVTVAARKLSLLLANTPTVERRDINSPDPIDVVFLSAEGTPVSGIEVTDEYIGVSKLEHEVIPAMLTLGLSHALVVSRGVATEQISEVSDFLGRAFSRFEQRIDLATVEVIEDWLSFPGADPDLATQYLWGVGDELDEFSKDANRRAWYDVLVAFVTQTD